jgi:hypothetical protein
MVPGRGTGRRAARARIRNERGAHETSFNADRRRVPANAAVAHGIEFSGSDVGAAAFPQIEGASGDPTVHWSTLRSRPHRVSPRPDPNSCNQATSPAAPSAVSPVVWKVTAGCEGIAASAGRNRRGASARVAISRRPGGMKSWGVPKRAPPPWRGMRWCGRATSWPAAARRRPRGSRRARYRFDGNVSLAVRLERYFRAWLASCGLPAKACVHHGGDAMAHAAGRSRPGGPRAGSVGGYHLTELSRRLIKCGRTYSSLTRRTRPLCQATVSRTYRTARGPGRRRRLRAPRSLGIGGIVAPRARARHRADLRPPGSRHHTALAVLARDLEWPRRRYRPGA